VRLLEPRLLMELFLLYPLALLPLHRCEGHQKVCQPTSVDE
jgi:hypothetical protein